MAMAAARISRDLLMACYALVAKSAKFPLRKLTPMGESHYSHECNLEWPAHASKHNGCNDEPLRQLAVTL